MGSEKGNWGMGGFVFLKGTELLVHSNDWKRKGGRQRSERKKCARETWEGERRGRKGDVG